MRVQKCKLHTKTEHAKIMQVPTFAILALYICIFPFKKFILF